MLVECSIYYCATISCWNGNRFYLVIMNLLLTFMNIKLQETNFLRLSSQQITLLLSSIWAQSLSPQNMPENYGAIAHTYSLVLLFSRAKVLAALIKHKDNFCICNFGYQYIHFLFLCFNQILSCFAEFQSRGSNSWFSASIFLAKHFSY